MSGHSKWSTIKHKKAAKDKKRGKIFTRIVKEITIAARDGGGDVDANASLRVAIQNAKGANLPKDTIERAINKGAGGDAANLVELTFEGYAPNGIAIFVECTTDNNKRTIANVRMVFSKNEGNLGTNGSLSFIFERKGVFTIERSSVSDHELEELEMELIDGGLESLEETEHLVMAYVAMDDFGNMQKCLENLEIEVQSAELQQIPNNTEIIGVEPSLKVLKLIDKMEELEDVNNVFHNLEMTDELMEALETE